MPCCEKLVINGVLTHEIGCPEAYKDYEIECSWCGTKFKPTERGQDCCSDECAEAYHG